MANTLFVPLVARIAVSKEFPEYFYDAKALELEQYLPAGATRGASQYTNMASVSRYYNMDKMVVTFAENCGVCGYLRYAVKLLRTNKESPEIAYFRAFDVIFRYFEAKTV